MVGMLQREEVDIQLGALTILAAREQVCDTRTTGEVSIALNMKGGERGGCYFKSDTASQRI